MLQALLLTIPPHCSCGSLSPSEMYSSQCKTLSGMPAHLVDPVGVQDAQAAQLPPSALLSHGAQIPGRLQLCHALVHRLSIHNTLHRQQCDEPPRPAPVVVAQCLMTASYIVASGSSLLEKPRRPCIL